MYTLKTKNGEIIFADVSIVKVKNKLDELLLGDATLKADSFFINIELNDSVKEGLAQSIRNERNRLLSESDWSQGSDIPSSLKEKYAVYRQKLRDITLQDGFPVNVVFPEKP